MENKISFSTNITVKKINIILSTLGLSEKYSAFEYLEFILLHMISNNNDSKECFKESLFLLMNKFNLTKRSVTQSLNKLLLTCNNPEITNKAQFNVINNGTLNKIRLVKSYVESKLKKT